MGLTPQGVAFGSEGTGWCVSPVRFDQVMLSASRTCCGDGSNFAAGSPGFAGVMLTMLINQSGMASLLFVCAVGGRTSPESPGRSWERKIDDVRELPTSHCRESQELR